MVRIVGLVLLFVSNIASWHMVLASLGAATSSKALRASVWKIATFYTLWALYNRYPGGRSGELGQYSFGLLAVTCLLTKYVLGSSRTEGGGQTPNKAIATKIPLVLACLVVAWNFSIVVPLIVSSGGPAGFAAKVWEGDTSALAVFWGYCFLAHMASNICLWSFACYRFFELPLSDEPEKDAIDSTTPLVEEGTV
mmetsp:Transcript_8554/g.17852  ORF Transcript_8554/g.17852 Transcript_8554/m.17852 type:complete len:195 (+) Transcript_8554:213-797(+)|eukprot:CAMPEP_0201123392 /NCGR_PEP_ID=MMETSP0850-20130426/6763_1 /ASSEMBLY_ACC=CAM_ASM_000622 /TAXON_ID=183588 /ORGANISM="Pseudo-nitzschia fraudulenta, Strain WWA7" /LENGTH=194 /DNA_ID=CAMNT_0047390277 /DNA_START=224 /DNA_END=808 /DNA_ORIENTATION=-